MLGRRRFCQTLAGVAVAGPAAWAAPAGTDALKIGQRYTAWFFEGRLEALWRRMTPRVQKTLGSFEALEAFRRQVAAQAGSEQRILRESVQTHPGVRTYLRYSRFDKATTPVVVSFDITPDERIASFYVRPLQQPAPSPHLDYRTKADLRLPFEGEWYVFWGGRTVVRNYHSAAADQRFAYDFVITKDGSTHRGDGRHNRDYYCWGEPILAPAPGRVVSLERLVADNPPGVMNPEDPAGNHVILDLGNDEFAVLAHMIANSIVVEKGDQVEAGQTIGRCGNSGNSSQPHLHFHLQDRPEFGEGQGLPAQFNGYIANGEYVARGEPVQGQTVLPVVPAGDDP